MWRYWVTNRRIGVNRPGRNDVWKYELGYPDGASSNTTNIKKTIKEKYESVWISDGSVKVDMHKYGEDFLHIHISNKDT